MFKIIYIVWKAKIVLFYVGKSKLWTLFEIVLCIVDSLKQEYMLGYDNRQFYNSWLSNNNPDSEVLLFQGYWIAAASSNMSISISSNIFLSFFVI